MANCILRNILQNTVSNPLKIMIVTSYMDLLWLSGFTQTGLVYNLKIVSFKHSNEKVFLWEHSHKKWKDGLEGSLDRVLLAAELEFLKILLPRRPQHASDVNIECAGESEWSKQQCSLHVASFLEH